MNIQSFTPPNRILMGPGPSNIHPRVLKAMGAPIIGHLDPVFIDMMDELKSLLQYAFQTRNALTMPISGPGSAGMEACFVNLVQPDDKVVVCRNGVFGSRMLENVTRTRGRPVVVDDTWGEPVDPQKLDDALKANPDAQLVAFVHAETSTGACSDVATLVEIAHRHGCLAIVDSVTALGGSPLKVDEWGVDAIYSGTQKCLSCVPGLAPLSFNEAAVERLKKRSEPVQSWFLDLNLLVGYWA
ncbi:MAG: alanine--glyoxylate aminotransferase family protein, partial [Gammaproteobacteria bacterium]|nr:alanine--glyoxylate aminotransferase family protein [Gammaproteobacteria bacterium]